MNKALYFAACLATLLSLAPAQTLSPSGNATTTTDRTNFGDRASQQVRQLRADIESVYRNTPLVGQTQLAPYLDAVSAAENALADLKTASEFEFSTRRTEFENAFTRAQRLWNDYRSTHGRSTESPALNAGAGSQ